MSAIWGVIPAAGSGSRMDPAVRKQFVRLRERSLLAWSAASLMALEDLEACMIVLPAAAYPAAGVACAQRRLRYCAGGETRADSVLNGLLALPGADGDWVLVHDAARPCLERADLDRLVASVRSTGVGGLLAAPVTETLKRVGPDGRVRETVPRDGLWRAQTPQMFRLDELRRALRAAGEAGASVTDEAAAMERAGYPVQVIEGSVRNIKVTYPQDLELADGFLRGASVPDDLDIPGNRADVELA